MDIVEKYQMAPVGDETIKAYVVDLRAYNEGRSEGIWVECKPDPRLILNKIHGFMEKQRQKHGDNREEYAVHDWEGPFDPDTEHPDWDEVAAVVEQYETYDDPNIVAAALLLEIPMSDLHEAYCGQVQHVEDFFYRKLEETGDMLDRDHPLRHYIDWEEYARDQVLNGEYDVVQVGYETNYIFRHV